MPQSAFEHNPTLSTPSSPTATSVVRWTDSTTLVSSGVLIDNSDNMTVPGYLYLSGDEKALRFYNGSNHVTVKASSSLGEDVVLTLPTTDGAANEFLQTNGSGVLTWAAATPTFVGVKATATSAQTITSGGNRTIGYNSTTTNNTTAFAFDSGYTGFDNGASSNETKLWRDEAGNNSGGIPWRSVLHVPVSGYYLISGSVGATNQGAGYYRIQFINETSQGFMQSRFEAFGDSDNVIQASCVAYLTGNTNGSNWIYMTLYQNSGDDMSVQPYASSGGTHFSLVKLG